VYICAQWDPIQLTNVLKYINMVQDEKVFIVCDVLKFSIKVFFIINTLLEAEMKLTYTIHLKVFLLSLGYVRSLKYVYILSHKILHVMCEFFVYAEFWKVNVDMCIYLCSMIILLMDVLFISV
jgi:hypothetical protein